MKRSEIEVMARTLRSGSPTQLGARFDGEGTNFAVFSANAAKIELCLFSSDGGGEVERIALPEKTGPIWHGSSRDWDRVLDMVSAPMAAMPRSRVFGLIPTSC